MRLLVVTATALAVGSVTAAAQDQDPPSRVGRLGYLAGSVSIRPAGDTEWAAAVPNRPLTTGDRVWTDTNARAEVQIGPTRLRLSSASELDIANLDDNTIQVSVPQGTLTARVRSLGNGEAEEIDTPNAAIGIGAPGEYRVDISPDGSQSTVKVYSGQVRVTAAGSSFDVNEHQQATINGTDSPTYDVVDIGPEDSWDQWNGDRDRREDASASARYVSAQVSGYDDLDGNGDWRDDPTYGPVWTPTTVVVGWSPYHYGHWVWEGPYGWTWVDDAPWGWAPFHYGRWVYAEDHWGWCPGRVYERPVWAPALVAFVGGRGWSAGVSFGGGVGVGWFPLAPEEPYYPSYHVSNTYIRNVNVTNVTNITNITNVTNVTNITYRNRELPGGTTVVPDNAFRNGEEVRRAAVQVPSGALMRAPVVGASPVVPTRRSIAPIETQHRPPAALSTRTVVAVRQPPRAAPSFDEQAKLLAAHPGRPAAPTELAQIKRPTPQPVVAVRSANEPVRPGATLKPARAVAVAPNAPKPAPAPNTPKPAPVPNAPTTPAAGTPRVSGPPVARPVPHPGYIAAPVPHPTPSQPRPPIAEPVRGPATATRVPQPPPRPTISSAPAPHPNLAQQYQQQRNEMETRHTQEAASPPANVSPPQLAKQQAQEHRTLDNTYVQARASGAKSMPPAPPPRAAAPAPRPAPPPPPRPAPAPARAAPSPRKPR